MVLLGFFKGYRVTIDEGGGGEEGGPVDLGPKWMFLGDSQTLGRATGTCLSHPTAFCRIWQTKYTSGTPVNPYTNLGTDPFLDGESGRSLLNTSGVYAQSSYRLSATMVWAQESGNQNWAGQLTSAEFSNTYKTFWRGVHQNTSAAVKLYETAFSFGRENDSFRNWGSYNTALLSANTELALEGINIRVIHTDLAIKQLQDMLTASAVWYQSGHGDAYHYNETGNLMVALAGYKALDYTITSADLADVVEVSNSNKLACLQVYAGLP